MNTSLRRVAFVFCAIVMVAFGQVAPQRVVLDFEELQGMTFISRSPIPKESRLSDAFVRTHGVRFSSGNSYVAVVENGMGHAVSGKNGIGGATSDDRLTYDAGIPVIARFLDPNNPAIAAVTDFVSMKGDLWGSDLPMTLKAFDAQGKLLAEDVTLDTGGAILKVASPGIHYVEFRGTLDDGGAAIDDFTFTKVTSTGIAAAPARLLPN